MKLFLKAGFGSFIILSLIFAAACTKDRTGQTSAIPNGDFENWGENLQPSGWTTNSCPFCEPPFETYIVQKDSSCYHGNYSVRLVYNNVYPAFAENKFPLNRHPMALGGYFKCTMNGTDTASVKIWLYKNRVAVDSGAWMCTSSVSEYIHFSIPISWYNTQVDTAIIRITGGHRQITLASNTIFWADYLELE